MIAVTPPDGATWSLEPVATPTGVAFVVRIPEMGIAIALAADRAEARSFARSVLAAAGDATERTFPRPLLQED